MPQSGRFVKRPYNGRLPRTGSRPQEAPGFFLHAHRAERRLFFAKSLIYLKTESEAGLHKDLCG